MCTIPASVTGSSGSTGGASGIRSKARTVDLASLARDWLHYESGGAKLRMAHRFIEWDGWEEGLGDSLLGLEEYEEDWYKDFTPDEAEPVTPPSNAMPLDGVTARGAAVAVDAAAAAANASGVPVDLQLGAGVGRRKPGQTSKVPALAHEREKEQVLDTTGDICGGRGGELGRRLEAWLTVTGIANGHDENGYPRTWSASRDDAHSEVVR